MSLELPLTLLAILCAGIAPNIFVAGGLGVAPMSVLAKYVLLPAVVIEAVIIVYARAAGYSRLFNRLVTGLWVGAIATTGLDVVRQPGTFFGYLAHDEARMAGEMILAPHDRHESGEARTGEEKHGGSKPADAHEASKADHSPPGPAGAGHGSVGAADFVGYAYHYWNGASFAAVYALLFGKTPWWGPLLYSVLFVETGMMGFMRAAMGPLTWGIFLVSLFAHVVFGLVVGVLLQHFVRDKGTILSLLSSPGPRRANS
jgi:hypothetical protein